MILHAHGNYATINGFEINVWCRWKQCDKKNYGYMKCHTMNYCDIRNTMLPHPSAQTKKVFATGTATEELKEMATSYTTKINLSTTFD